ncbi:hypothetical protein DFH06DRAFT_1167220 [Mycena polygramma]|nr:hypothetical protein DFH06DRAFT_1167220 [Mycena polygramma]
MARSLVLFAQTLLIPNFILPPETAYPSPNFTVENILNHKFAMSNTFASTVEIYSTSPHRSFLEILPGDMIFEICETLRADEGRESLLSLGQVCRDLQQPAIMAYAGLSQSDIADGELTISNTTLFKALPQLSQIMSRDSGVKRLTIRLSGSPDIVFDKIRLLGHFAQFISPVPITSGVTAYTP